MTKRHEVRFREAYAFEPGRVAQGYHLSQMKAYANMRIANDEDGSMRCSVIDEISYLCSYIGTVEKLMESQVYSSFRILGYNIRYSDNQGGCPDVLYELGEHVENCMRSYNKALMDFTMHDDTLFTNAKPDVYRVLRSERAIAKKEAKAYGIRLSDLNLFNVLTGVEAFTENEPNYIEEKGAWLIDDCLSALKQARRKLKFRDLSLQCILNHEDEMGQ